MGKIPLLKIIAIALVLFFQGCYMGQEAYYSGYDGFYEPPPIVFAGPPDVIVIPDTNYVYVVPDTGVDLFFYDGWWWRPWESRWYRSQYYNRGWSYYNHVPSFYFDVDPGWRGYYRARNWYGHRWDYERIHYHQLHQNWKRWRNERYWERQATWGVQNYQPRPQDQRQELRKERQQQYQRTHPAKQVQRQPLVQQPQRKYRVQQLQTPPQIQQPKVQPQVEQPKVEPRIQQPKIQPQIQQPKVERRIQQPKAEPQIQQPKVEPRIQQPKIQPQVQQPKVEPRIQEPQTQPEGQ